jgi:hypothetical protein
VLNPSIERVHPAVCSAHDAQILSKHHRWRARWQNDQSEGVATCETVLGGRLEGEHGTPRNADEVALSLVPKHGSHNAPAMVQALDPSFKRTCRRSGA